MDEYTTPMRRCNVCGAEHPETPDYFPKGARYKNGLKPQCKACSRDRIKSWRQNNPEKAAAQRKRGYDKHRDARIAYSQKWYSEHLGERREYDRQRRINQRPQIKAWQKAWVSKNPDYQREYNHRHIETKRVYRRIKKAEYRARKHLLPSTLTTADWLTAVSYFNSCCAVCGRQMRDLFGDVQVHADHWIPITKGGATTPSNIVPLCGGKDGCNNSKHNREPQEWLIEKFGKRKAREILGRVEAYFEWVKERGITYEAE